MEKEIFLSRDDLIYFLQQKDSKDLFFKANEYTKKLKKDFVHFRGIIEFSNICQKNCLYCALRKDQKINRYTMTKEEILSCAMFAWKKGYGSIVLQSAELTIPSRISFLMDLIKEIKEKTNLGITLSLGELDEDVLLDFFKRGAHRYLLRIESSNKKIYEKIHPKDHKFENRLNCLLNLKKIGYQVGTGVMIGLPFQTIQDLADDLIFFKKMDIDMLGMGPYVENKNTPLKEKAILKNPFDLSIKMIALARLFLKDINIAATTALQVFKLNGREIALKAGANILMPIITPTDKRKDYLIYPDKPCVNESKEECQICLEKRMKSINKKIAYDEYGDSAHYFKRIKK
ncbi:MAG: [FeFe] hydrogenase maturase subunit HydE [Candidatus Anoxychlamydiales bacterium]|nr:[FeFe] hydrogenase maturase subunit HydE [Candidatus Anoxychlamydiales bacterium]